MQISNENKGRTDSNNLTEPNEAVRVAAFYYYGIYIIKDKSKVKWKPPPHPSLPPAEPGRKRKRYHVVWTN